MGRAICFSDKDLERAWDDISAWDVRGEVVAAGAGVSYCGILWEKEGVWGGATGRGRKTIFRSKCVI